MKVITKTNGVKQEHDIPAQPFTAVVHRPNIKVEAPDAYTISPADTVKCMQEMSQKAWVHISTGPLFQHFFGILFKDDPVTLPETIAALNEDYDEGVVHACGLIVLMCEAAFENKQQIFIKTPEAHLHPACVYHLMSMILEIRKLWPPGSEPDVESIA